MEKAVDLRQVNEAIRRLRERGDRVSNRSVHAIVGGSMTTVHKFLDEALSNERALSTMPTSALSEVLVKTMLVEIASQVQAATEGLEQRLAEMSAREQELLVDFEGSEVRVANLEQQLEVLQTQLMGERQAAEKASAVALEQQAGLREQIGKLELENDTLIRSGEMARTESAKAQLQVERADLAAKKAEDRVRELEGRLIDLSGEVKEAEKRSAVAEQHAQDLTERVAELVAQSDLHADALKKSEKALDHLRLELEKAHKAAADADKSAALADQRSESRVRELEGRVAELDRAKSEAEKGAAVAEELRVELNTANKAVAEADKRAALAEQRLSLIEKSEKSAV